MVVMMSICGEIKPKTIPIGKNNTREKFVKAKEKRQTHKWVETMNTYCVRERGNENESE